MPEQFFSGIWGSYIVAIGIPLLICKLFSLKQREKINHTVTWTNLQAEAPLSHGCSLQLSCPMQHSGVGAAPLNVPQLEILHYHDQVSWPRAGTRGEGFCSCTRKQLFGVSFYHPHTTGWSAGFPEVQINVETMQMVVESHRSSTGTVAEEHNRPRCVDKINLKISFPVWFYLKVSFLVFSPHSLICSRQKT